MKNVSENGLYTSRDYKTKSTISEDITQYK